VTCLRAVKQAGSQTLLIGHFRTPDRTSMPNSQPKVARLRTGSAGFASSLPERSLPALSSAQAKTAAKSGKCCRSQLTEK
jgi:hypothetical protein